MAYFPSGFIGARPMSERDLIAQQRSDAMGQDFFARNQMAAQQKEQGRQAEAERLNHANMQGQQIAAQQASQRFAADRASSDAQNARDDAYSNATDPRLRYLDERRLGQAADRSANLINTQAGANVWQGTEHMQDQRALDLNRGRLDALSTMQKGNIDSRLLQQRGQQERASKSSLTPQEQFKAQTINLDGGVIAVPNGKGGWTFHTPPGSAALRSNAMSEKDIIGLAQKRWAISQESDDGETWEESLIATRRQIESLKQPIPTEPRMVNERPTGMPSSIGNATRILDQMERPKRTGNAIHMGNATRILDQIQRPAQQLMDEQGQSDSRLKALQGGPVSRQQAPVDPRIPQGPTGPVQQMRPGTMVPGTPDSATMLRGSPLGGALQDVFLSDPEFVDHAITEPALNAQQFVKKFGGGDTGYKDYLAARQQASSSVRNIQNERQYSALPDGALYRTPDGSVKRKGKAR